MSNDSLFMVKTKMSILAMLFSEVKEMDLLQIGRFISQLRKEQGLSQEQLGERLGVTNKTISRWETGTYLPPAEMLLSMSAIFDVSVNELLSGKRLRENEYKAAAEENLKNAVKTSSFSLEEKITFYKKKWLKEHIPIMCCWGIAIIGAFLAGIICKQSLLLSAAMLLLVIGHCWRNNAMMTYVEHRAFDGTGR